MQGIRSALFETGERLSVVLEPTSLFSNVASAAIMFGIIFGGLAVMYLVRWAITACCYSPRQKSPSRLGTGTQIAHTLKYVVVDLLFIIAVVAIIWFGSFAAGFSFLNSPFLALGLSLVGTYGLMHGIQDYFNGMRAHICDLYDVGDYVRFPSLGPEIHGNIVGFYAFYVLLRRSVKDQRQPVDIKVSYTNFMVADSIHEYALDQPPEEDTRAAVKNVKFNVNRFDKLV